MPPIWKSKKYMQHIWDVNNQVQFEEEYVVHLD